MERKEMIERMKEIKADFINDFSRPAGKDDVAYKKGDDFKVFGTRKVSLKWSNMSGGFPIEICGLKFDSTEHAYQAAHFKGETEKGREIQETIQSISNGFLMKKQVMRQNAEYVREDWEKDAHLKYEWMLYLVWQKCLQNPSFAKMLTACPAESVFIEDSTGCNGLSAEQWGCTNKERWKARRAAEQAVEDRFGATGRASLVFDDLKRYGVVFTMLDRHFSLKISDLKIAARNNVQAVGEWKGMNMMGKILKLCQLALLTGTEPEIDYGLINSAGINILGKRMVVGEVSEKKAA